MVGTCFVAVVVDAGMSRLDSVVDVVVASFGHGLSGGWCHCLVLLVVDCCCECLVRWNLVVRELKLVSGKQISNYYIKVFKSQ